MAPKESAVWEFIFKDDTVTALRGNAKATCCSCNSSAGCRCTSDRVSVLAVVVVAVAVGSARHKYIEYIRENDAFIHSFIHLHSFKYLMDQLCSSLLAQVLLPYLRIS
jgi:hypothetical protein